MHHIPDDVFLIAARELAASVREEDLAQGSLYPPLGAIREVSLRIAVGITKYAYCKGKFDAVPCDMRSDARTHQHIFRFCYYFFFEHIVNALHDNSIYEHTIWQYFDRNDNG